MKKQLALLLFVMTMVIANTTAYAQTINEADTELCDTFKYALISSLREPVDKAIVQIYKDDKDAPEGLTWASYDTKILKIEQVYGVGGLYELTLKVYPYYDAHNNYGVDEVIINTEGELLGFKHLKKIPLN
ncbi:DUF3888 domain-containing protein [Bacillus alkalicellulosilyticus]|uniref:DUF3888 domain-containing protein n=1 Tax=Alkalihalobacterium alkalicellulosilyticum TaxID=1912214 RepID=UPI000998DCE7|nr:DUF3888 domain-containing protein [Bacillus alkalicellulosilyticus]